MDLAHLDDQSLLSLRVKVETEMSSRGLAFSVGAIGEELAIVHFNSTRGLPTLLAAPPGTKNVDALSRDGERYSIKTQLKAKKSGTIYPDDEDPDRQLFEYLLIVRLKPDYSLKSIHRFSWDNFVTLRSWDRRMSAWYLSCSGKNLHQGEVIFEP
tara:strand:- start:252 stop:716 length:465 start_codon:yes stop_codon:yes gene_type:complete